MSSSFSTPLLTTYRKLEDANL